MKIDVFKNIPFISKRLKPLRDFAFGIKTTLKNDKVKQGIINDLSSKFHEENFGALKKLLKVYYEGEDISAFLPKIIMLLTTDNDDVKRIAQFILVELASLVLNKSDLILAVSPLHKEILNPKGITRGNAIKLLSALSAHIPDILLILFTTIKKIHLDKNAYVRRCMVLALIKIVLVDKNDDLDHEDVLLILEAYQRDIAFIKGPAVIFTNMIEKDIKLQRVHGMFRVICKDILKFHPYDATLLMDMIYRYSLIYLYHFRRENQLQQKGKKAFEEDQDIILMKNTVEKACITQSLALIVEASKIALTFGDEGLILKVINALIKFFNTGSEIKYVSLQALEQMSKKYHHLMSPYYKKFYPLTLEKLYCRSLKLKLLYLISDAANQNDILKEYIYHSNSSSKEMTAHSLHYLGKLALKHKKVSGKVIKYLVSIMTGKNSHNASNAVMALTDYISDVVLLLNLLALEEKTSVLAFCLDNFSKIEMPIAKFKILTLVIENIEKLPTLSCNCFKLITQNFIKENTEIKLKSLELGFNLSRYLKLSNPHYEEFCLLFSHLIELGSFDLNPTIREYTRFIKITKAIQNQNEYQIYSKNLLKTTAIDVQEEETNYGFVSYLLNLQYDQSKEKISGYRPLPPLEVRMQESTAHLREPPKEVKVQYDTKKKQETTNNEVQNQPEGSNEPAKIEKTIAEETTNIPSIGNTNQINDLKINLVDKEKLNEFFGSDDEEDDGQQM